MKRLFVLLSSILACYANITYAQPLSEYDLNRPFGWCMVNGSVTGGEGGQEIVATTADEFFAALDLRDPNDRSKRNVKAVIYVQGSIEVSEIHILHVQNKTIIGLPGARLYSTNTDKKNGGILKFSEDCENIIIRNLIFEGPGSYDVDTTVWTAIWTVLMVPITSLSAGQGLATRKTRWQVALAVQTTTVSPTFGGRATRMQTKTQAS